MFWSITHDALVNSAREFARKMGSILGIDFVDVFFQEIWTACPAQEATGFPLGIYIEDVSRGDPRFAGSNFLLTVYFYSRLYKFNPTTPIIISTTSARVIKRSLDAYYTFPPETKVCGIWQRG